MVKKQLTSFQQAKKAIYPNYLVYPIYQFAKALPLIYPWLHPLYT